MWDVNYVLAQPTLLQSLLVHLEKSTSLVPLPVKQINNYTIILQLYQTTTNHTSLHKYHSTVDKSFNPNIQLQHRGTQTQYLVHAPTSQMYKHNITLKCGVHNISVKTTQIPLQSLLRTHTHKQPINHTN